MKGALAATMVAARRARELELRGDVVVTAVIDEEVGSLGTTALVRAWRADGAIVAEPTDEQLCVAHKGFAAFEVVTHGRAAHGSRPDLGIDAIARMGPVLDRHRRARPHARRTAGASARRASLRARVPDRGRAGVLELSGRVPAQGRAPDAAGRARRATVERELHALVDGVEGAELELTFSREPYEAAADEPFVATVHRHAGGDLAGAAYWADSALLAEAGIPTVLYGPRGEGAHAAVEWVELESLERCADLYTAVAADFCS